MIVEESIHVFDETSHVEQGSLKNCAEEDEQNIFLKNLETCLEKQPIDSAKQPVEIQQNNLPVDCTPTIKLVKAWWNLRSI